MHIAVKVYLLSLVISAATGYVVCALFNSKAITLGDKLLARAENDYHAALNHILSFIKK